MQSRVPLTPVPFPRWRGKGRASGESPSLRAGRGSSTNQTGLCTCPVPGLDLIVSERADEVIDLVCDIASKVEAEVLITDDLDSYKDVADEVDLDHQIGRRHVKRTVDELAQRLPDQLNQAEPVPDRVESSAE